MGWPRMVGVGLLALAAAASFVLVTGDAGSESGAHGRVSARTLPRPDGVVWTSSFDAAQMLPVGGVSADGDVVVVTSSGGHHGFDAETGDLRWRVPLELAGHHLVIGDGLVAGAADGAVVAFDVRDGSRAWIWPPGGGTAEEHEVFPVHIGLGKVFTVTAPDVLVALDAVTGEGAWSMLFRDELAASVTGIVGHGRGLLYVLLSRPAGATGPAVTRTVAAIDPAAGAVRWEADAPIGARLEGGEIFVPQPEGPLRILDAASGEEVGTLGLPLPPPQQPSEGGIGYPISRAEIDWFDVHDDVLVAVNGERIAAVSRSSNRVLWSQRLRDATGRIMSTDSDAVYVATAASLIAVDLHDGTMREIDRHDDGTHAGVVAGPDGLLVILGRQDASLTARVGSELRWTATVITPTRLRPQPAGTDAVVIPTPAGIEVLDVADGALRWQSGAGQRGPPLMAAATSGRRTFVLRPRQDPEAPGPGLGWMELAALEVDDGDPIWTQNLTEEQIATADLVATRDSVFLGTTTGVSAYNANGGRPRFVFSTEGLRIERTGAVTHLAADEDLLVFVVAPHPFGRSPSQPADGTRELHGHDRLLVVVDAATGNIHWQKPLSACGPPTILDRTILVPTVSGLTALDLTDATPIWTVATPQPSCWPAVAAANTVIAVTDTSTVAALDATTGTRTWTAELEQPISAQPVIAGDGLLVPAGKRLLELALNDGQQRWQLDTPHPIDAAPTVVSNILIVSSASGLRTAMK